MIEPIEMIANCTGDGKEVGKHIDFFVRYMEEWYCLEANATRVSGEKDYVLIKCFIGTFICDARYNNYNIGTVLLLLQSLLFHY